MTLPIPQSFYPEDFITRADEIAGKNGMTPKACYDLDEELRQQEVNTTQYLKRDLWWARRRAIEVADGFSVHTRGGKPQRHFMYDLETKESLEITKEDARAYFDDLNKRMGNTYLKYFGV